MRGYKNLIECVLKEGKFKGDRTNTGTISVFGLQTKYNLAEGFPLLTTKKVHWKSVVHELLWFIKGDTNIKYLVDNNVRIWNEWPYEKFKKSNEYEGESLQEFVEKIKNNKEFSEKHGNLGPVYGKQWRNFEGIDQLKEVINSIKTNPESRRLIVSSWNPPRIEEMALPPCHAFFQFYVSDNKLSCQLYQRSADIFLGVPFNIASYSLLTHMIAKECNLEVGEFVHTLGDAHIYSNHMEQVKEQMKREVRSLPKLKINGSKSIFELKYEDIELTGYDPHPTIKAKVAI